MYLPDLTLASHGFSESLGISQVFPFFITPSILPSTQSTPILLDVIPHFLDISTVVKYSIHPSLSLKHELYPDILYYIHLSEQNQLITHFYMT